MYVLLIVLAVLVVLILTVSYLLVRLMSHPKFFTTEQTIEIERGKGFLEGYDELPKEDYIIKSFDGYELHTTLIPYEGSKKVAIISHGHTYSRWGSVKYLMIFRKLGYNAVIYDDRGHGDNAKHPVSMGFRESRDLMAVIADTRERFGEDCIMGLHGESMGTGLTLQALQYHPKVDFIVADCGYSDLMYFTKMFISDGMHLPKFLVDVANLVCRVTCGYWITQVSPITYLADNEIPICFIHGEKDDLINVVNAKRMYEANKGYKELHLFAKAGHAQSYETEPEKYYDVVTKFVRKVEGDL